MASAKVASAPRVVAGMSLRPSPAALSVRKASFFGPSLTLQRSASGSVARAREAVKVEARGSTKAGQQIQVSLQTCGMRGRPSRNLLDEHRRSLKIYI